MSTEGANRAFTLEELSLRASRALSEVAQPSARVREQLEIRTIRYYTTLGLLDKPLYFKGRTAFYDQRHVAQLVAVKRLQAKGLSLQEVQRQMLGLTAEALLALADLPSHPRAQPASSSRSHAFWREPPAVAVAPTAPLPEPPIQGVRLSPRATLLLEGVAQPLRKEEIEALHHAAEPLLRLLESLSLGGHK